MLQFYSEDHGNKRQTIGAHIFYSNCLRFYFGQGSPLLEEVFTMTHYSFHQGDKTEKQGRPQLRTLFRFGLRIIQLEN